MSVPAKEPSARAVNIRLGDDTRSLIDRAAQAQGRSRSEFMVAAARRAAEEALLDQTVFVLEPDAFDDFMRRLDQPPKANEALKRTLAAPAPWTIG